MLDHISIRTDQSTLSATKQRRGPRKIARLAMWLATVAICGANAIPVPAAIPIIIRPTSPPPQVLPRIDGFTPLSGAPGTRVTITGVNLGNAVSVQIGGVAAPLLSKSASNVVTSVPNGARSGDITVTTNADDTARSAAAFNVLVTRVQSFSPSSGPPDTIVTLSGSGLGAASQVKFGAVAAPILFKNDNQVTTKVPSNAPASDFITVVTPTGNPKTDRAFGLIARVVAAPSIARLTPASGPVGTAVVIAGANLSGVTSVKFNGVSANFDVTSPTEIRAIVPSGATSGRVSVARGTQSAQSTTNFSVTTTTNATRSIVGRITSSANPQLGLANVAVRRYQNGRFEEKRTDSGGNYVFTNVAAGVHLIIPIQSGIVFSNTQGVGFANVTVAASSISSVDFKGRQLSGVFSIAGKITNKNGAPMPGVYVFASNLLANGGAMTNERGEYRFINLPAGLYIFYPLKSGHVFNPPDRAGNLAVNSVGNDFRVTTAPVAPANDSFATPQVLPGNSGRATGSNANATKQIGEPGHANIPTGQSLWYRWTAPANGLLTLTTAGSITPFTSGPVPADTVLAVYSGTAVNALTAIGANNDVSTSDRTSRVVISVVAGRSYLIAVDTPYFLFGNLVLSYSFAAATTPTPTPPSTAPANDNFAKAQGISGISGRVIGRVNGATKENGEPIHHGVGGGHSVWYRWTAPGNGMTTITTAGSTFDSVLAVYSGTSVGALTKIVSNDDAATGVGTSSVSFAATSGRVYFIAVDGYRTAVGNLTLNWNQVLDRGPRNDDFVNAQVIANASGRVTGSNVDADKETGEPLHNGNAGGKSIWYRWTAPSSGTATFDTVGSAVDTVMAVYNGTSVGALTRVASDDDSGGNRTSRVSFSTVAGRVYFIAVDGYNGAAGSIVLNWSSSGGGGGGQSPANDNFVNAQVIAGTSGRVTGSNVGATRESGESLLVSDSQGKSIWYRWTAPSSGTATFNTNGSSFDTILGVFTSTALLTVDDDGGDGLNSLLSFPAVAGTTYFIEVADAVDGATGSVVLNWSLAGGGNGGSAPANDNSSNAQVIAGASGRVTGSNVGATRESDEPLLQSTSQGKSIWYRWTAPSSGTATFNTNGSSFDTVLGIYTTSEFIGFDDDGGDGLSSLLSFTAIAGTTYFIEVADAIDGETGSVVLNWVLTTGGAAAMTAAANTSESSDQSTLRLSPIVLSKAMTNNHSIGPRFARGFSSLTKPRSMRRL